MWRPVDVIAAYLLGDAVGPMTPLRVGSDAVDEDCLVVEDCLIIVVDGRFVVDICWGFTARFVVAGRVVVVVLVVVAVKPIHCEDCERAEASDLDFVTLTLVALLRMMPFPLSLTPPSF
jgi:hypothetical protein